MARDVEPNDLARFLERHPWSAQMLESGQTPLEFLWRFEVELPVATMWPLLVDTSRLNRAMGLPEMHYQERDGRMIGEASYGGFKHVWIEHPWEWVFGRTCLSIREYSRGFARWVRGIFEVGEINPGGTGFELWVYFGWIPRNWLGRKALASGFASVRPSYQQVLDSLTASARVGEVAPIYRLVRPSLDADGEAQLEAKLRELLAAGMPESLIQQLAEHLRSADELELARIQPKPLARRFGVEPRELLRLCLHATRVGLLDLSWDIVCPHCRGTREEAASLSRIPGDSHCDACELDFDTRSETSVEVTFRVNSTVRKVGQRHWCAAEPAHREHILVQQRLAPGERRSVSLRASEGLYRLRSGGSIELLELRRGAAEGPAAWTTREAPSGPRDPALELELRNDADEPRSFVLERAQWSDEATRPGDLLSLHEFRDMFSQDYLASEVQLAVGMQTILFTDIVGSTRFYATRGDAEAFVQVRAHFAEIFAVVAEHDGVVVKTIGDAVMAAFVDAASAVRAAHAIQQRFPAERRDLAIRVRISINRGPCIAVRFNTEIDYFGNAVNLAAKLQASADAGQVACTTDVHDAPGVAEALAEFGVELETLTQDIPALGREFVVRRWTVDSPAPAQTGT